MRNAGAGAAAIITIIGIAYADYLTGVELRLFPLYFIPLGFLAWRFGAGAGIIASITTTAAWEIANRSAGRLYSENWIVWWNLTAMLSVFLAMSAVAASQKRRLERERALARVDTLTGVANGRMFYEIAGREIARVRRTPSPLTIAYVDLDNFKAVNDTVGHAGGDEVLIATASLLRDSCRRGTDLVARLGGDEFAFLLPDTDAEAANAVLKTICEQFRATSHLRGWPLSLSVGAICYMQPPDSVDAMVKSADALMYEVKKTGKDRYQISLV